MLSKPKVEDFYKIMGLGLLGRSFQCRVAQSGRSVTIGDCTTSPYLSIPLFWVVYYCFALFVPDVHYIMCAQCLSLFL